MKVILTSDTHLDSDLSLFYSGSAKELQRRKDQKVSFSRVIDKALEEAADMLLLPGDLFDNKSVTADTVSFLKEQFSRMPNVGVYISPGSSDNLTGTSPYNSDGWPENVYIFKGDIEYAEKDNVRVYGFGRRRQISRANCLLKDNEPPILDDRFINILSVYAGTDTEYNCVPLTDLQRCGFDLCVLGSHRENGRMQSVANVSYIHPGSCESRDFSESTGPNAPESGAYIVNIDAPKKKPEALFFATSVRKNIVKQMDVTGSETNDNCLRKIRALCDNKRDIYKVILTGNVPAGSVNIQVMQKQLQEEYFYIKLIPSFNSGISDIKTHMLSTEKSYKGSCMQLYESYASSRSERKAENEEVLSYLLKAFESEVTADEDM